MLIFTYGYPKCLGKTDHGKIASDMRVWPRGKASAFTTKGLLLRLHAVSPGNALHASDVEVLQGYFREVPWVVRGRGGDRAATNYGQTCQSISSNIC